METMDDLVAGLTAPPPEEPASKALVQELISPSESSPQPPPTPQESEPEPEPEPVGDELSGQPDEPPEAADALAGDLAQRQQAAEAEREAARAQRLAMEAEQQAARAQRDAYGRTLAEIGKRLGDPNGEPTAEQWNTLREHDHARYAAEWADYQRREISRRDVQTEQQRVAYEQHMEGVARFREAVEAERTKLYKALPVLADPAKSADEMRALRSYAATLGYSEQEMDQAYDHRMIVAVSKARAYDNLMAAQRATQQAARTKLDNAPAMPAPGGRQPMKSRQQAAREAAQKRFDQSGRVDDAVSLLIQ